MTEKDAYFAGGYKGNILYDTYSPRYFVMKGNFRMRQGRRMEYNLSQFRIMYWLPYCLWFYEKICTVVNISIADITATHF